MGSDRDERRRYTGMYISIHAPRMGSDLTLDGFAVLAFANFNPRSPHGERRLPEVPFRRLRTISIHAPRMGSDLTFHPTAL